MPKTIYSQVVIKKPIVKYRDLRKEGVCGLAYNYLDGDGHKAEVCITLSDAETCKTLFHELCHLMLPDLKESQIIRLEKTYGHAVWETVLRLKRKWKKQGRI